MSRNPVEREPALGASENPGTTGTPQPTPESRSAATVGSATGHLSPTTSVAMAYLRAYSGQWEGVRGHKRAVKRAEHMLRMHWSIVGTTP